VGSEVEVNEAIGSGTGGFRVMGTGHELRGCSAVEGRKRGVALLGSDLRVENCVANRNGGDGLTGSGMNWHLAGNQAVGNGGDGISVRGRGVVDGGSNRGSDNGRTETSVRPTVQCEISGRPCQP
jgi:hypothetical protein